MSDGTDADATIEKSRRSLKKRLRRQPGAPIARAPIPNKHSSREHTQRHNDFASIEQITPESPIDLLTSTVHEPALAGPLRVEDGELGTPGGRRSRAYPDAPAQVSPARPERALTVVDGDADEDQEPDTGVSIDPRTATTLGDFAAAMVGPVSAAAFAGSLAVFLGSALFVMLIRSQARRSALSDSEVSGLSPVAAGFGAAALTLAVEPASGLVHALSAGLVALLAGALAALLLRAVVDRFVHTRVAVLGDAAAAHDLAWQLSSAGNRRFTIIGYVTRTSERDNLRDLEHVSFKVRRLGLLSDLSHVVARNDIDLLVMSGTEDRMKVFERAAVCTERYRTRLLSLTAFEESVFRRVPLDNLNVAWFQHVMHPRFKPAPRMITRTIDTLFGVVAGLITLPIWAPVALFMRLAFGKPVLVERRRVGERGRAIGLFRFRVARRDITGGAPDEDQPPVGFGKFLRATRIEQLPTLINLIRGELTLVGPRAARPQRLAELEREIPFYGRRNMLKPGLTGWAQLHDSRDPETELSNDLFYLKHQSLMLYAFVLMATLWRPIARRQSATTSN
ncbi:MAG: sugar transferase [Thermoleophilaceae bacterium]|nr:sugar transferase [Thermoleophilaceae bacterium]